MFDFATELQTKRELRIGGHDVWNSWHPNSPEYMPDDEELREVYGLTEDEIKIVRRGNREG